MTEITISGEFSRKVVEAVTKALLNLLKDNFRQLELGFSQINMKNPPVVYNDT